MRPDDEFQDLLHDSLLGKGTAEEQAAAEALTAGDEHRAMTLARMRVALGMVERPPLPRLDAAAFTQAVLSQSAQSGTRAPVLGYMLSRRRWPALVGGTLGAAILGVVLFALGGSAKERTGVPVMYTAYSTTNAQRATITLPDGGHVVLNAASRLEIPVDYSRGNRVVRLEGEGLFTVAHREGAPFSVVTGSTTTRVLGTTFLVRHYRDDVADSVVVRDGKVVVGKTILTANQALLVRHGDGLAQVSVASPTAFGFATGVLTLDGVPLRAAIGELNRWYDADLRLGDAALATRPIAGEFTAGSLTDLAFVLQETFDLRVVRDGRVLTLYANPQ